MAIPFPANENERLKTLQKYQILDSEPEKVFDDLTRAAQKICGTQVAIISLIDENRQWFKSKIGVEASETDRELAFCAHTILQTDPLVVPDALSDERFADNPLVAGDPHIRFYAGVPLITPEGHALGSLCVVDREPRKLSKEQLQALKELGNQVEIELQKRRQRLLLQEVAIKRQREQKKFLQKITVGLGVVSTLIVGLGFTFSWSSSQISSNDKLVALTFQINATLENIDAGIHDARSLVFSYAIAEQDRSIQAYYERVTTVQRELKILKQQALDSIQQQRIETLSSLISERLRIWQEMIALRREKGIQAVASLVDSERNLVLLNKFDILFAQMRARERELLQMRSASAISSTQTATLVSAIGTLIILLIVAGTYYLIYREVIKRRQVEDNLQEQKDFTDAILDIAQALVAVVSPKGQIVRFNRTCEHVTGYTHTELQGKKFQEVFPPHEQDNYIQAIYDGSEITQFPRQYESSCLTKSGQTRLIQWSNSTILDRQKGVFYIISTGIDITERRQAEIKLEDQREWLEITLSSIGDAVVATDDRANITFMNSVAEDLTGWPAQEAIGQSIYEVIVIADDKVNQLLKVPIESTLRERKVNGLPKNTALIHPDGRIIPIDDSCSPILRSNGQLEGAVMVFRDITNQKQWETEIEQALQKEKELSELKSKFISIASHEFRTPLTTILSSVELMEMSGHKWTQERKDRHFKQIKSSVARMNQMLSDVLIIGKAESRNLEYKPQPLNLEQFCQELIEEMQQSAGSSHEICFTIQGNCSNACMDRSLLLHILSNLLSNAIKYSPQGGAVDFELNCTKNEAIFRIRDRGIGIPSSELPKLFNQFYRAENVGNIQGTGLGLSIVKTCVDRHSGSIKVSSELEVGTTFLVTLPLNKQEHSS